MIDLLKEMKFNNLIEFIKKREIFKIYYILLTHNEKVIFKTYVYKLNYKNKVKDKIWEYLNEPKMSPYFVSDFELFELARIYGRNKNRIGI